MTGVQTCALPICKGGPDKHTLFREMLKAAKKRGLTPDFVAFDGWYAATKTMRMIREELGWEFVTRLKKNRQVSFSDGPKLRVEHLDWGPETAARVHVKSFGLGKVCRIVPRKTRDTIYLLASCETWTGEQIEEAYDHRPVIEEVFRGAKQALCLGRCQARSAQAQRNHIHFALRSLIQTERRRGRDGTTIYQQRAELFREATRAHLTALA